MQQCFSCEKSTCSLDFCVIRYILYVLQWSRVSSSAPIYKVDSFKTKGGKVRQRKNGVNWALDGDGWFCIVIFHGPTLSLDCKETVSETFKLVLFVPILLSYNVAPFSFEANYFSQKVTKRSVLCREEWSEHNSVIL